MRTCTGALVLGCVVLRCALLSCYVLSDSVSAQQSPESSGLIAGQVVDKLTGLPVPGAAVTVLRGASQVEAEIERRLVRTTPDPEVEVDSQGRFVISNLGAGRFTLSVTAPNAEEEFAAVELRTNDRVTDVLVRMRRLASVAGTVRDDTGDPIVGAPVTAFIKATVLARRVLMSKALPARTDDRGRFRIANLSPGSYLLCVCEDHQQAIDPVLSKLLNLDAATVSSPTRFGRTFHPGSILTSGATPIRLGVGDDRTDVNIQVQATRPVGVSGRLQAVSVDASTAMTLMLVPSGDLDALGATTLKPTTVTPDGTFEFADVPPGTYSFEAFPKDPQKGAWASLPIAVSSENITGLLVPLRVGATLSGQLEFRGTGARPTAQSLEQAVISFVPVDPSPRLMLADRTAMLIGQWSPVEGNGSFRVPNVPPGRYLATVRGLSGWSESDPIVTVGDRDTVGAVVAMTDSMPGSIEATLELERYESPQGVKVVLFPADSAMWVELFRNSRRFLTRTGITSTFRFPDLPAGDYFLTRESPELDFTQESLELLSRTATRVTVQAGETAKVTIRR